MKNVNVLPTNKPSKLFKDDLGYYSSFEILQRSNFTNIHLYITSDEEIKEGDWCCYLNNLGGGNVLCQAYKHSEDKRMLFDNGTHNREIGEGITPLIGECKKIILTTDQDLIKDGVQPIPDEFLEWFVKNPSCEYVETVNVPYFDESGYSYLLIVPKEEPKNTSLLLKCSCLHPQVNCFSGMCSYCNRPIVKPLTTEDLKSKQEIPNPINNIREKVEELRKQETLQEFAKKTLANNVDGLRDALKDDDLFFFYKDVILRYGEAMADEWQGEEYLTKEQIEEVALQLYPNQSYWIGSGDTSRLYDPNERDRLNWIKGVLWLQERKKT